jgi:hypothetical protein
MLRRDCSRCGGDGWIHVEHPARPGIIMQSWPCPRCNPDGHYSDNVSHCTISWGVDTGTCSSTATTSVTIYDDGTISSNYGIRADPSENPLEVHIRPQGMFPRPPLVLSPPGRFARPCVPRARLHRGARQGGIGTKNWHRSGR